MQPETVSLAWVCCPSLFGDANRFEVDHRPNWCNPTDPEHMSNILINAPESASKTQPKTLRDTKVSFFNAPASNKIPNGELTWKEVYNLIVGEQYADIIQRLRAINDEKEFKEFKRAAFDYITPSGTFSYCADACLTAHSGAMVLDLDKMEPQLMLKAMDQMLHDPCLPPLLQFVSPSGRGFKTVVPINPELADNHTWFTAIECYLKQTYGLELDKSGKNVSRPCFLCHDSGCYIAPMLLDADSDRELSESMRWVRGDVDERPFDLFYWIEQAQTPQPKTSPTPALPENEDELTDRLSMQLCIEEIERSGLNMVDDYNEWLLAGLSIVEVMGEEGREWFHRLSRTSRKYDSGDCDRKYSELLRNTQHKVGKGTFFDMASRSGIDLGALSRKARQLMAEREGNATFDTFDSFDNFHLQLSITDMESTDLGAGTTICDKLRPEWLTPTIQQVIAHERTIAHQDMMLLTTTTALSGVMPNVYGYYGGKIVYPNLYLMISAPPASGKGRMDSVKKALRPISRLIQAECHQEQEHYEQECVEYQAEGGAKTGRPMPKRPPMRSLLIPGDSSATAFAQRLNDNMGEGIIFETEADTLSQAFISEHGNYSDSLRKIFHHEEISYLRRKDNEYVTIEEPRLTLILSATPGQVVKLLPSSENGLFSRIAFYQLAPKVEWRNPFAENDQPIDDFYAQIGERYFPIYQQLRQLNGKPVQFSLTQSQQQQFNQFFDPLFQEQYSMRGYGILGSMSRMGLIAYRLCMVLSVMRHMDSGNTEFPRTLVCHQHDFFMAMTIANQLVNHTVHAYSILPKEHEHHATPRINRGSTICQLYDAMADEFTTQDIIAHGKRLGISDSAARKHLANMVDSNMASRVKNGRYRKTK